VDSRRALLRWTGWFVAANAAVLGLLGLRFMLSVPWEPDVLGIVYAVLAFVGQFALLAFLPALIIVIPLCLLVPRRGLVMPVAVVLAAASATLLVVDGNVFAEQRYHLTPLTAMLFERPTWILVGVIGASALAFEAMLAGSVAGWVAARPARGGRWLALGLVLAWTGGQLIHIWADALGHLPVTQLTRYLPAYFPIHAKRTLARLGLVDEAAADRRMLLQKVGGDAAGQLQYPLSPLQCAADGPTPNIVWVILDALRPDATDPALMPELAKLKAEGQEFANHWSGGNSSRAGIFSMFYGLPSTYIDTFYGVQQAPVLMQQVQARGYQLGLFAAPGFTAPTDIGRTVFAGVPGLGGEQGGMTAVARNRAVTDDWLAWMARRDPGRPFFGFLYYDPPMGEMSADALPAQPMDDRFATDPKVQGEWRKYRRSAHMVDGEVGRVVDALRRDGLLERTLVIVLSDHGYEFDDNGLGYIGHASDYSTAQLRATLVMRWPGRAPAVYRHRSSHYDLPVTLLQDLFGCRNDPADYAVGRNLFAGGDWPWIIAGSYNSHAIVEPGRAIVTHPGGYVEVLGPDYRPLPGASFDPAVVGAALRDMRRFYR
jgi:uncharacterized protein